jgi:hypothetical protein
MQRGGARVGERAAFAELYGEFADRIYGFCDVAADRDEPPTRATTRSSGC